MLGEERDQRHQDARRAKPTLKGMRVAEGLLQWMEHTARRSKPFYGSDLDTVHLHGEEEARSHGLAVHEHGTRATNAVLASDVCAGELELVT
jgi:hypothetical protein